ncbi:MAG: hydratase [Spirochaetaceae bacterium]|jgi:aconitate hydratase|nr:hydratase [Spirochaetaceae bacterium]
MHESIRLTDTPIGTNKKGSIASQILTAHSQGSDTLHIKFDALASHDITYVNIVQTATACGLKEFPVPYVLTNCHNSLCAVGGTINEDDHRFGLSAAKKFGGIFVPPHQAVIHSYVRETVAACGKMVLGSDSHTRYGALGCMGVGEGGGELVRQLLEKTYDLPFPKIISVRLTGSPAWGVGPQDVALALIGAVFKNGFVKNAVLEFSGPGLQNLSADFRCGIDVMTTETACLSSIWATDNIIEEYYRIHGRPEDFKRLQASEDAFYDALIEIDLSKVESMIALPFHPSNAFSIKALLENPGDILRECEKETGLELTNKVDAQGRIHIDQAVIAGCAGGTYENIVEASTILNQTPATCYLLPAPLSIYPGSMPVFLALDKAGVVSALTQKGAVLRTAFCGPCFGAGDVPFNGGLSIRHSTRNFPNREGSKPANGQSASVALMDARSIAATVANGGCLTSSKEQVAGSKDKELSATCSLLPAPYTYNDAPYKSSVYNGWRQARMSEPLLYGPNIKPWPEFSVLKKHLLLKIASFITDPVTTTDEIIPSGETSSFRSNPIGLAEFTLSRKDPGYVARAKAVRDGMDEQLSDVINREPRQPREQISIGSCIFAMKPGDGSAREQAASCQRVLGGLANIAVEYATKRYRSNLINWGILPFIIEETDTIPFGLGDYLFIPDIAEKLKKGESEFDCTVLSGEKAHQKSIKLSVGNLSAEERDIILKGCLINYMR